MLLYKTVKLTQILSIYWAFSNDGSKISIRYRKYL